MPIEADLPPSAPTLPQSELKNRLWWWQALVVPNPNPNRDDAVTDGDNVWVELDEGWFGRRTRYVRLARIDAPEIRGEERPEGLQSKARLAELLPVGTRVYLHTFKDQDNFGRFVADVYGPAPGNEGAYTLLNALLVDEGLAEYKTYR